MYESFQLEDARGEVRSIDFAFAKTWEVMSPFEHADSNNTRH
jgi:hypothetical protein